jgi:xylulokinase
MPYIATFDVGTTAVKGVLTDLKGRVAAVQSLEIPTLLNGEQKEQDPQSWWDAFLSISRTFTAEVDPAGILGIAMSGQMQDLILLDESLLPVCNAILYSDGRAGEQARRLEEQVGEENFRNLTGNRCDGSLPLPKLMWVREERPALYARTRHLLISSKDYLVARLTGICCGDVTACSTAGAMNIRTKCWEEPLLRAAGVSAELFPALCASHRRVGGVLEAAAAQSGYRAGTPVYVGVGDAGAVALASGIAGPGQYHINLGTSGWVAAVSEDVLLSEAGVFNLAAMSENRYLNVVPFLNAGNVHRWASGVFGGPGARGAADYAAMSALLKDSVPGSHGVLCLPYLSGERFPVPAPEARGCYVGLTPSTSAADLSRSCLEGVAYSIRQGMELLRFAPESISLIGGGAREEVWCRILADVLGREILVFRDSEFLPSLAVASIVRLASGNISRYEQFCDSLPIQNGCVRYRPDADNRRLYDRLYGCYCELYPGVKDLLRRTRGAAG